MARFFFFDSFLTISGRTTSSSFNNNSAAEPDYCGLPESGNYILTEASTRSYTSQSAAALLSESGSSYATEIVSNGSSTSYSYFFTRADVTSPTYSYTNGTNQGTQTGGGLTFRTTGTTDSVVTLKATTTAETQVFNFGLTTASQSFRTTTQATNLTITFYTTKTGYAFCDIIDGAAFLWALDPWMDPVQSVSRKTPAYYITSPIPDGSNMSGKSISAVGVSGTGHALSVDSSEHFYTTGTQAAETLYCSPNGVDIFVNGGRTTGSGIGQTCRKFRSFQIEATPPQNILLRQCPKISALYVDPGQELSTAQLFSAYLPQLSYTLTDGSFVGDFVAVSNYQRATVSNSTLSGNSVFSPFSFTGIAPGRISVGTVTRRARFSWNSQSSLCFSSFNQTDTGEGTISFGKTSVDSSQMTSFAQSMDILYPPLMRRSDSNFDPLASYGGSKTFILLSTGSSGSTTSFTESQLVSTYVASQEWGRPKRKIASVYPHTISSESYSVAQGAARLYLAGEAGGAPNPAAFTTLYGGLAGHHQDETQGRSPALVEDSRGNNAERTVL